MKKKMRHKKIKMIDTEYMQEGWKKNIWGKPISYGLDVDGDGVPDDEDCKPLDKRRHALPPTATKQEIMQQIQQRQGQRAVQRTSLHQQAQQVVQQKRETLRQQRIARDTVRERAILQQRQAQQRRTQQPVSAIIPQPQVKRWLPNPLAHTWIGKQLGWDK